MQAILKIYTQSDKTLHCVQAHTKFACLLGVRTFHPMQFQPMQFQPLTNLSYYIFKLLQFRPKLILANGS